jgi:hypothetical protein
MKKGKGRDRRGLPETLPTVKNVNEKEKPKHDQKDDIPKPTDEGVSGVYHYCNIRDQ